MLLARQVVLSRSTGALPRVLQHLAGRLTVTRTDSSREMGPYLSSSGSRGIVTREGRKSVKEFGNSAHRVTAD